MSSYHAWTHAEKERGGTDPIPGLGAWPRINLHTTSDIAVVTGVPTNPFIFDDPTNTVIYATPGWTDYFEAGEDVTSGADEWVVYINRPGFYHARFTPSFATSTIPTWAQIQWVVLQGSGHPALMAHNKGNWAEDNLPNAVTDWVFVEQEDIDDATPNNYVTPLALHTSGTDRDVGGTFTVVRMGSGSPVALVP